MLFISAVVAAVLALCTADRLAEPRADFHSLIFVHAVWRHGDRTPSILIPSDTKNNITSWKLGLGELTAKGMAQQYRLGKYLRQRYDGFLGQEYSPFEVYYRSSDYNRTLASAQANAAGLFTPNDDEMFTKDLRWRPIPVHTLPKHTDRVLFDSADCPTADAEEKRLYADEEVQQIERANDGLLRLLGEKSGYGRVPMALRDVWDVFDPLNSEFNHPEDHQLPDWVTEDVRENIWEIYNVSCRYLYGSDLLTRLRGGPLFAEILNRMKNVAGGLNDRREKLFAYSAHDTSVAGILSAFGAQPHVFPHYATVALIELHRTDAGDFVKLLYKNETDGTRLWELEIPNCPAPCSLTNLERARSAIIPLNWAEECGLYSWYEFDTRAYYFMIATLLLIVAALIIEVAVLSVRLQRSRRDANSGGTVRRRGADPADAEDGETGNADRPLVMVITTALSLFLLFWCTLFLVDLYLRSNQNEKYLAFVERRGFSVSPFQLRFYVNRSSDHGGGYSSLSFMRTWSSTASQRALRTLLGWFSVGALVGLVCFAVTPLYLTWLLAVELGNVWRLLRWRGGGFVGSHPLAAFLPSSTLAPLEQENVNFRVAISDLNSPDNSLFYIPLQEHVQTGITPVIPGVNIPWSHLPLFMFVLIVAGVFHELGHAIAAINANVRLNGFGVFLFAVYPGAFTELETDELSRSSSAQKLRIFTAGIWHNIILAFVGILIIWCAPIFFALFYETGRGVVITDVSEKSGLYGANGFQPGHIVTQINQCPVSNSTEWTQCLERMHNRQVAGAPKIVPLTTATGGYLVQYAKVVPLTASTANVYDTTQSGEVQCCAEFENVSPSHICFRYYPTLAQLFKPADGGGGGDVGEPPTRHRSYAEDGGAETLGRRANRIPPRANNRADPAPGQDGAAEENVVQPPPAGEEKSAAAAVVKPPPNGGDGQLASPKNNDSPTVERAKTSPAPKFADSLGLKKLVKRSAIPERKLDDTLLEAPPVGPIEPKQDQPRAAMMTRPQPPSSVNVLNVERSKKELLERVVRHACLPARQITDHAACDQMDEFMNLKRVPPGYVCVTPALYNGTALLRFELKNRSRPVLFVGFLSEPLYMIDLMDITPRFEWIPFWIPLVVELFGKYLLTFSLAMALLNAVPCYGLDGQFMCETVVDYFCSRRPVEERQKICSRIIMFGTTIFSLNVAIGLIKFLINYSR